MTTNHSRGVRARFAIKIASLPADYHLPFAACYVYSPKGETEVSQRSRQLCARVKSGSTKWLRSYATAVHQLVLHGRRFLEFFDEHTLLVPIPEYRPSGHTTFWGCAASRTRPPGDRAGGRSMDRTAAGQLSGEVVVGMDVGAANGTATLSVVCGHSVVKTGEENRAR